MFTPSMPGWPRLESRVVREPVAEPWDLIEMHIEDPDGLRIVLAGFLPVILSAVTRDRRDLRDGEPPGA